jgi:hypothetical protein
VLKSLMSCAAVSAHTIVTIIVLRRRVKMEDKHKERRYCQTNKDAVSNGGLEEVEGLKTAERERVRRVLNIGLYVACAEFRKVPPWPGRTRDRKDILLAQRRTPITFHFDLQPFFPSFLP